MFFYVIMLVWTAACVYVSADGYVCMLWVACRANNFEYRNRVESFGVVCMKPL